MTQDMAEVGTIDAPLQPDEEELAKILDQPLGTRRGREDEVVAAEAAPPAPDSEYFTAPLLDENNTEMGR